MASSLRRGLTWLLCLTPLVCHGAEPAVSPTGSPTALVQQHLAVMAPLAAAIDAHALTFDFLIEDPALDQHVHVYWQSGLFRQERAALLPSAYGYDGTDFWYGSAETLPYRLDRERPADVTDQQVSFLYYALPTQAPWVRELTAEELAEAKRVPQLQGFDLLAYCPPDMSEEWLLVDTQTHQLRGSLLGDDRSMDASGVLQLTLFGDWQDFGGIHYPATLRELRVLPDGAVVREAPVQTVSILPAAEPLPAESFSMASAPAIAVPALPSGRLSVPFRLVDDDITLDLRASDGKPLVLKFDSGANVGLLRFDVARRLGLAAGGSQPISGHGGTAELGLVKLEHLTLSDVELPPFSAAVIPQEQPGEPTSLTASLQEAGVHGLIGTILLNAFVVTVDFQAKTLTLYEAHTFAPETTVPGATVLPYYRNGLPYTNVVVDGKLKGGAFFNTGARPYFNLEVWALDREGLEYPIEDFATGISIHGMQLFGMIRPRQVELGGLVIKQPRTFLEMLGPGDPPEPSRMASFGSEFFHDHRVTFDLYHERLYVEPYSRR
jgi:hypothetical protein